MEANVKPLEDELARNSLQYKRDWLNYNGGSTTRNPKDYEKPTFFNIALNYVPLNMDQLMKRAGKVVSHPAAAAVTKVPAPAPAKSVQVDSASEKKPVSRAKVEEARPTPEPQAPAHGGISSLLGAWWGRS
jgi:signal recognition particle subunit SRP68